MSWQDDYYRGSSDYPITGEDEIPADIYFDDADCDLADTLVGDHTELD